MANVIPLSPQSVNNMLGLTPQIHAFDENTAVIDCMHCDDGKVDTARALHCLQDGDTRRFVGVSCDTCKSSYTVEMWDDGSPRET